MVLTILEAKRAGLLAEIGLVEEAQKILEKSLNIIREKQNLVPVSTDYSDVSDEAYLMLLLQCVKQSVLIIKSDYSQITEVRKEFSERFNYLNQYKCRPWEELYLFELELDSPYFEKVKVSQEHTFRIGRVTTTQNWGFNNKAYKEIVAAYSFLRFCEDIGVAYRLPGLNIAQKSAQGCLTRIGKYSSHWALVTLLRIGDDKAIDKIFDRRSVYDLTVTRCDELVDFYINKLRELRNSFTTESSPYTISFEARMAKFIPEILSRLCCKASFRLRKRLMDFVVEIYSSEYKSKYVGINNLLKMLLDSLSDEQKFLYIPKLLKVPIPENVSVIEETKFRNPFEFLEINNSSLNIQNRRPSSQSTLLS